MHGFAQELRRLGSMVQQQRKASREPKQQPLPDPSDHSSGELEQLRAVIAELELQLSEVSSAFVGNIKRLLLSLQLGQVSVC